MEQDVDPLDVTIDNVDIVEKDGKLIIKTWFKVSCYMETQLNEKEQKFTAIEKNLKEAIKKASEEVERAMKVSLKRSLEF